MTRYRVARRSPEDDAALFRLYEEVFGSARADASRHRWRWQYLENPGSPEGPAVWVAWDGPHPLGQMGTMPVALWWGGREVTASWGMDYFVKREAEGRGLGPLLARTWGGAVDVALAMGLTPPAHAVYGRLGFRDLGRIPLLQAVLDPLAVARRRLGRLLGSVAGPLLGLVLRKGRARQAAPGIDLRTVSQVGPEYDALWRKARASYAMCVRRDAAYVRWKYLQSPHRRYDLLEARRGDELAGFAVSREEECRGLRLGWIVDVFAEASDTEAKDALIGALVQRFRGSGVARAQAFSLNSALEADLRRHGFFAAESKALLCVKCSVEPGQVFDEPGRWHVVFGDGDMDR